MAPELRSKREKINAETKEDISHLLKEIFDFCQDETFYKIFSREASHRIQYITNMANEELENLEWKEDGDAHKIEAFEAGMSRSLNNYFKHLKVKEIFPSNTRDV